MEGEVIVVAVDATAEITDYAVEWAVCNVTKAMDSLILLVVLPAQGKPPTKQNHAPLWSQKTRFLSCLMAKWGQGNKKESFSAGEGLGLIDQDSKKWIEYSCSRMMHRLCSAHNVVQVHTEVKIVADAQLGSVAMKAKELEATWVILDRHLKNEGESCMKYLKCNVMVIDHTIPKILRAESSSSSTTDRVCKGQKDISEVADKLDMLCISKPDNLKTKSQSSLCISSDPDSFFSPSSAEKDQLHQTGASCMKTKSTDSLLNLNSQNFVKGPETETCLNPSLYGKPKVQRLHVFDSPRKSFGGHTRAAQRALVPGRRSTDSVGWPRKSECRNTLRQGSMNRNSSIRRAISVPVKHPPMPSPRCSICKHKIPSILNGPRKFSYEEIEKATNRFSLENFLAEGGYSSVYKGVLSDGQVIAVKQHKTLSAKEALEFCSEVEVLSCAQHKNLVTLVGYCIEKTWLLVYEFACNGSLDQHLYGGGDKKEVMGWQNRMKVAMGAARGLRYLHEDCRVGCIVHRDFRPSNILLTHDFEAMVGDFGLARWQVDDRSTEETQVVGAFGYLAPEYMQTGLITEKTDVYSFGMVLLEFISGSKATDLSRKMGQEFKQGLPLFKRIRIDELIDPRLEQNYVKEEVECMIYAASLCILQDAAQRPRMSKIVKILEGDIPQDILPDIGQHAPVNHPTQYMNHIYGTKSPSTWSLDYVPSEHPSEQIHSLMHSAYRDDGFDGGLKQLMPSTEPEEICSSYIGLQQSEPSFSEEYEAYLRGSLVKFIQNTK